jgi:hypothetical protein
MSETSNGVIGKPKNLGKILAKQLAIIKIVENIIPIFVE